MLFVGTKKQAQESIADEAIRVGMPYVNQRWLGGMPSPTSPPCTSGCNGLASGYAMEQTGGFEGRTKAKTLG